VLGPAPQILPDSTLAPPRVSLWDFHRIEIETNNSRPAFLVLSEIFYPRGWRATADGKPVEIVQANFVLRGLEVPAGTKKIELTFDSAAYRWGRRLSFTLFPLFLLMVAEETWRVGRKRKGNPTG